ncbi:hypothetical protein Arno162_40 [Pectobacterium phage Arno162]|uniref:Uncharacterized protein n=1 Tax=Pectobacterium phage Arno162 TaxID=2500577 RepID=A0A678ZS15_9CAUD|nr:hypothetical protein Arno162_40 [Pectobacterium phage Arno162]
MKMYGRKSSPFGMAYRDSARKHERQFYNSLKRACKKRERQAGQLQCKEGIEEYDLELQEWSQEYWDDDFGLYYDHGNWEDELLAGGLWDFDWLDDDYRDDGGDPDWDGE